MTIVHPDINETHYVEVSNAALSNITVSELDLEDSLPALDTQLIINKADLNRILLKQVTLEKLVELGQAGIKGDASNIERLTEAKKSPDMIRSNYVVKIDETKCVAC